MRATGCTIEEARAFLHPDLSAKALADEKFLETIKTDVGACGKPPAIEVNFEAND